MTMTSTRAEPRIGGKHAGSVVTRRQIADTASTTELLGLEGGDCVGEATSASVHPWTRRFAERNPIGWRVSPSSTRSARISPITVENLKPWPEHADAT